MKQKIDKLTRAYINMNENITHTPEDIEKAKRFLM